MEVISIMGELIETARAVAAWLVVGRHTRLLSAVTHDLPITLAAGDWLSQLTPFVNSSLTYLITLLS